MNRVFTRPWLKAFSGLFINFSAGFFGLTLLVPNLANSRDINMFVILTWNLFFGIVFLFASIKAEEILEAL